MPQGNAVRNRGKCATGDNPGDVTHAGDVAYLSAIVTGHEGDLWELIVQREAE